ncbi:hypothetical protein G3A_06760 [Bacillus sp. 17376]|uniref:Polymerase beta nucleotidyltransferase domain-containing protein n=1 Tax=Mesobacillus boroniphilus JCM 21738 TaxID=1294265 RepID=W4RKF1_9BACI|nr:nucleotidyltransferase domain-containing protein [Mesobacillus boroniphilus]ESU33377.1 hypothetical protein G3A_06760 [Bacillus sp. 17376]GAE44791.1 hypothetical protein JCM21738_1533 [Mesobacillus boroniphilus JCM 21738]
MVINDALEVLSNSLKHDKRVQAIFVKGSVGSGEQDEHSDLDLYCLVKERDLYGLHQNRVSHLEAYNIGVKCYAGGPVLPVR